MNLLQVVIVIVLYRENALHMNVPRNFIAQGSFPVAENGEMMLPRKK